MEKIKREAYVSIDRDERDILRGLSHRERALYMELKWLADFKTGAIRKFGKRVVSYQMLADLISVPARQGRAADKFDAKEASRLLIRLIDAGLVGEITTDSAGGLTFALPLSPIAKEAARRERLDAEIAATKLPKDLHSEPARGASEKAQLPLENDSQSVMTVLQDHQYTFQDTEPVNNKAGLQPATAARSTAAGENSEFLVAGSADHTGAAAAAAAAALSTNAIKKALHARHFNYVDTRESSVMYERWISAGHSHQRITEAIEIAADDFTTMPTPARVDEELRHFRKRRENEMREEQRRRRRGGVAL